MTTFAYPVTQRGADTNRASFNTNLESQLMMETSIAFGQTSLAGVANTITPANFIIPTGARITDVVADIRTAWAGSAALSGTTLNFLQGTAVIGSLSLETAGRVRPTYTGAQLTAMASGVSVDTTVSFVVSVSGSVVPNAGLASLLIFLV